MMSKVLVLLLPALASSLNSMVKVGTTGQPNLKLVPGVDPSKTMAADYGFDPLGLAKFDISVDSARDKERSPEEVVKTYRDSELRHGRLAMLAALAWPMQELYDGPLARGLGERVLLTADGRSPSLLNGGLEQGPIPAVLLGTALAIAALDLRALKIKEDSGDDWLPGDYGFDPLKILKGASPYAVKEMQAKEINNGRLAMLAVAAYVAQEAWFGEPIVVTSEKFFTPLYEYPWIQQLLNDAFAIASFRH